MNDGLMMLTLDEPVQGITIDCTKIIFLTSNFHVNDTENATFSAYCDYPAADADTMTVSVD